MPPFTWWAKVGLNAQTPEDIARRLASACSRLRNPHTVESDGRWGLVVRFSDGTTAIYRRRVSRVLTARRRDWRRFQPRSFA